jgi:hypothetical protein
MGASWHTGFAECFSHLTVGRRVANRCISGHCFHARKHAFRRISYDGLLDAAVLVAKGDLEMKYFFTVTLKSEMPRLNDTSVYGANGHFVHFFAIDLVKVHDANACSARIPRFARISEAHRFEPRMAFRSNSPLLEQFAFE